MIVAALVYATSDAQGKSANGVEGLVVFLFLAVAVVFLLRSMTKHLRKAQQLPDDAPPTEDRPHIDDAS